MVAVEEAKLIEGFESSFGIELLATVDWLIYGLFIRKVI